MRTSIRPWLAVTASVVALLATTSTTATANASVSDIEPQRVLDCSLGHEHQVYGGESWARCGGDSGKYQVRADCRKPDGTLTTRSGPMRTVPNANDSRVRCLADEMPIEAWIYAEPMLITDPRPPYRPCVRTDLPVPARTDDTFIEGADSSGRYQVGYSYDEAMDEEHMLLWDNGVLSDITGDFTDPRPADVNSRGQVIGTRRNPYHDEYFGFRLQPDGDYDELPTRGRYKEAEPAVINNAGQIAGQLFGYDLETGWSGEVPVLWSADNVLTLLPMPTGYDHATIEDIDEDGTVLGNVRDLESDRRAPIVWHPDGTWRLLADPESRFQVTATSIRNGKVVGRELLPNRDAWPLIYVWDAATGEATLSPILGLPDALNSEGSFAGRLRGPVRMGFWGPGEPVARPLPVDDWIGNVTTVVALADNDVAFGYAVRPDRVTYLPIKWDCST